MGFATALVQISESTPLYKMETVYRRALESLQTKEWTNGAFRSLLDRWFYALEEEVVGAGLVSSNDERGIERLVGDLLEKRLAAVSATQPQFAIALRACHRAHMAGDLPALDALVAWLMGQPNVSSTARRQAGLRGDIDHRGATGFLRGLIEVLRQTGRPGLVLVLDEVETIQRVRADSRERSLNALRQIIDDLFAGQMPGLYVLVTGTPLFFDGPQGVRRLEPLAQRLRTDFGSDPRFDNPRAVQVRLTPFDDGKVLEVGRRIRDLYPSDETDRIRMRVTDAVLASLANNVSSAVGGQLSVVPRLYLKKLVDMIDRVDQYPDFSPVEHFELKLDISEMSDEERAAAGVVRSIDDISLDLQVPGPGGRLE
jgi:hypothetical protein